MYEREEEGEGGRGREEGGRGREREGGGRKGGREREGVREEDRSTEAAVMKSMCPLESSSFSKCCGIIDSSTGGIYSTHNYTVIYSSVCGISAFCGCQHTVHLYQGRR